MLTPTPIPVKRDGGRRRNVIVVTGELSKNCRTPACPWSDCRGDTVLMTRLALSRVSRVPRTGSPRSNLGTSRASRTPLQWKTDASHEVRVAGIGAQAVEDWVG